jgi:hypothetical protein
MPCLLISCNVMSDNAIDLQYDRRSFESESHLSSRFMRALKTLVSYIGLHAYGLPIPYRMIMYAMSKLQEQCRYLKVARGTILYLCGRQPKAQEERVFCSEVSWRWM